MSRTVSIMRHVYKCDVFLSPILTKFKPQLNVNTLVFQESTKLTGSVFAIPQVVCFHGHETGEGRLELRGLLLYAATCGWYENNESLQANRSEQWTQKFLHRTCSLPSSSFELCKHCCRSILQLRSSSIIKNKFPSIFSKASGAAKVMHVAWL